MRLLSLLLALAPALVLTPAAAPQDPPPAPAPQPTPQPTPEPAPTPEPPAPARETQRPAEGGERARRHKPRPVSREGLLKELAAIAKAARQLAESPGQDEADAAIARQIVWMAEQIQADLNPGGNEPEEGAAAAGDEPAAQPAPSAEKAVKPEPSGKRIEPAAWQPVIAPELVRTQWGTNVREAAQKAGGSRLFIGQHHLAVSRGGAVLNTFYEPSRDYTFKDCIFEGAPAEDGRVHTRWGFRAYDVIDWRFLHCEWRNIPDEHACYLSAPGSVLWSNCRFEGIGSQAIQVVYRWEPPYAHETSDPSLRNLGGLQAVEECLFLECGKPTGGRPSYTISFFEGPRCDVRVARSYMRTTQSSHLDNKGLPSSSYGAIMVHDRPSVEILDTYVDYRRPDRPVIQIWNVEDVLIQGCEVVEGEIELRNCRRVRLLGNKGAAHVTLGTGPAYVWPMPKVTYEGPLSADYAP